MLFVALCICSTAAKCAAQGTVHFQFEGPPPLQPQDSIFVQEYYESGAWFRPIGIVGPGFGFDRVRSGFPADPDNGGALLRAALGDSLLFSFLDGAAFTLLSVDLGEYSTGQAEPLAVRLVGYRQDGSTLTTDLTTDGIIGGTGPLVDFQTFNFGPEWSGLSRVEIPTALWSLDNLVVSIPEPGTWALLVLGGVLVGCRFWKRRQRGREAKQ